MSSTTTSSTTTATTPTKIDQDALVHYVPELVRPLLPSPVSSLLAATTLSTLQNRAITSGLVPDAVLRRASRMLLATRKNECNALGVQELAAYKEQFIANLKAMPIAIETQAANEQHYEVPAEFYLHTLGPRLKYSCALYPTMTESLKEAEEHMLRAYVNRAQLTNGQRVLDLGCGWGSFTLFAAPLFPQSQFVSISNSNSQREFIMSRAKALGLQNVNVITCDVNALSLEKVLPYLQAGASSSSSKSTEDLLFDRVISIEMFEHMKNYEKLFALVGSFLKPRGLLFVHIFVHKSYPYHFETEGWMAKYFFSGGTMPSADLLHFFARPLHLVRQWNVDGRHYARTSRQWLERLDEQWYQILPHMRKAYSAGGASGTTESDAAALNAMRMWRVFFIAVEELFAYDQGQEWFVSHYLFEKPGSSSSASA